MSEVIKVCVKQQLVTIGEILTEVFLKRIIEDGRPADSLKFKRYPVKFTIQAEYGPTKEDPFADHVTLTITE